MMAEASLAKKYSTFSPSRQREISSPLGADVIRNSADVLRGGVGVVVPCTCFFRSASMLEPRERFYLCKRV